MSKGKKRGHGARRRDWLDGIRPSGHCMKSGLLNVGDFDEQVSEAVHLALTMFHERQYMLTLLLGLDSRWRPVLVLEGPEGRAPTWKRDDGQVTVTVSGPLMDNLHVVRQVFERLGVDAAVLVAESWQGPATSDADGLSSADHRAQAFGRGEALVIDAYYPAADYERFVVAPMVRVGMSVTASVLDDTGDPDSESLTSGSMLRSCFPATQRVLRF